MDVGRQFKYIQDIVLKFLEVVPDRLSKLIITNLTAAGSESDPLKR